MRRGQAAIQYLTMVAVALIMVALVVRMLHRIATETGQTISSAAESLNKAVISAISNATSG
jgi:uncharacterized protein (UPF0333 family)